MDNEFIKDLFKFIKEQEGNFSLSLNNGYEISVVSLPITESNTYTIYVKRPNEDVFKEVGTVDEIELFREVFLGQSI